MAWKRGTSNNQGGEIRLGHVAAFLLPKASELNSTRELRVLPATDSPDDGRHCNSCVAYISSEQEVDGGSLYLHSHSHPTSVILAIPSSHVAKGCIVMGDNLRVNSKVCSYATMAFASYTGDVYALDAREGIVGATALHHATKPPKTLHAVRLLVRPRSLEPRASPLTVDAKRASALLALDLQGVILSVNDIYTVRLEGKDGEELCCRVHLLEACDEDTEEKEEDEEKEREDDEEDTYRGIVGPTTVIVLDQDPATSLESLALLLAPSYLPLARRRRDLVDVWTSDGEVFPVRRALLRPCLRLTHVVQRGYGRYKLDGVVSSRDRVEVDVDCCTFDRVLLYLQHVQAYAADSAARPFVFDPLLAADLLAAGESLQVQGLVDAAQRVLGSFQERVRPGFISLETVRARNAAGSAAFAAVGKRSETWIVMDGMVFDLSRWLAEHPGGSSIIPEHALDCDCTHLFEVYHASRQSFAYLKEFYIGELHPSDIAILGGEAASETFLKHLALVTPWRKRRAEMQEAAAFKSF